MSRSYKKNPVSKIKNDSKYKKYSNKKIRHKYDISPRGYFKKIVNQYDICDCSCRCSWKEHLVYRPECTRNDWEKEFLTLGFNRNQNKWRT